MAKPRSRSKVKKKHNPPYRLGKGAVVCARSRTACDRLNSNLLYTRAVHHVYRLYKSEKCTSCLFDVYVWYVVWIKNKICAKRIKNRWVTLLNEICVRIPFFVLNVQLYYRWYSKLGRARSCVYPLLYLFRSFFIFLVGFVFLLSSYNVGTCHWRKYAESIPYMVIHGVSAWNPTSTGHRQIMQLNICIRATCIKYFRFQQKTCRIATYIFERIENCAIFIIPAFDYSLYYFTFFAFLYQFLFTSHKYVR